MHEDMSSKGPAEPGQQQRARLVYCDSTVETSTGRRLLDIILESYPEHRHICGGHGFCTSCRIEVVAGPENLSPVSALERQRLGREAGRLRLACQTRLLGDAAVRVPLPTSSRFSPFDEADDSN